MESLLASATAALDADGGIVVTSAEWSDDALILRLEVRQADEEPTRWRVVARSVREHRVELGWCYEISLENEHPLLWPHLDRHASLYFLGRPASAQETVGSLWSAHQRETRGWMRLDRFCNPELPLDALLDRGFGLLASGPERLLRAYGTVLAVAGVEWSLAGQGPARIWDQTPSARLDEWKPLPEGKPFRALTLGDSYVVAADFTASRA